MAPRPGVAGELATMALHVQGVELADELADAEVRLAPDEVARLVSELVEGLPAGERQELVARLSTAPG